MKIIAYIGDAELLHPECAEKVYGREELARMGAVFDYDFENWHQQDEKGEWVDMGCTCGEIASVVETREGCPHKGGTT